MKHRGPSLGAHGWKSGRSIHIANSSGGPVRPIETGRAGSCYSSSDSVFHCHSGDTVQCVWTSNFGPSDRALRAWRRWRSFVFASGMPLSAFGQAPVTPPPARRRQARRPSRPRPQNPAVVNGTPLSMDEAVRMALENNLGIRERAAEPRDPELRRRRAPTSAFAPALFSSVTRGNSTSPPTDFLSTGGASVVTSGSLITSRRPAAGAAVGRRQLSVLLGRVARDDRRAAHGVQPAARLAPERASYTQPLLRNFKIDAFRQQLFQSQNQQQVADIQLRSASTQTVAERPRRLLRPVGAIAGLDVAQQSLDLARQSLKNNQTRVEVGTMAPIDIVDGRSGSREQRGERDRRRGGDRDARRISCAR